MFYAYCVAGKTDGPWGPVWAAATERGVAAIEQLSTAEGFAAGLARRGLVPSTRDAGEAAERWLAAALEAVDALLRGEAWPVDALPLDVDDRPVWDRTVLAAVRAIPRGTTLSYGEVARLADRPGAARAVGGAVGRNPVGLVIPCHRVIAADGSLGGYGAAAWGGREAALEVKAALLELEGVRIPRGAGVAQATPRRSRATLT
jgi:methylated-DNA-[protein]-cysteine S-methyltransferase